MAAETFHSPTPEELMEYVDGEGTPASRASIQAHLATCPACQARAAGQRGLSRELSAWQVTPAPDTLHAPEPGEQVVARPWWRPTPYMMAGLSTAAVVLVLVSYQARRSPAPSVRAAVAKANESVSQLYALGRGGPTWERGARVERGLPPPANAQEERSLQTQGPAVIRTATLQVVAKDFAGARTAVDVILDSAGGFADQLGVAADPGSARVLRGMLRVPGTRLTEVLTRLRALGQVTHDQQNAQDVSEQLVDLDARLKSTRATEQRLIDLLKNRTGKLTDVLEVEQQLTRVRLDIERLDAQKTNMTRRVAYATIDLMISEERKAGLDPGPLPLLTQLRIAAADGLQSVVDTLVGVTLFALRAGPTLLLWGVAGLSVWLAVKRYRRSVRSTASE
jgi:hypothetical protein